MAQIKVFVDTNIFPIGDFPRSVNGKKIKYSFSSVTERELEGTDIIEELPDSGKELEIAIWDESYWGNALWGSTENQLEKIISIISSSSFPPIGKRGFLRDGERRQLRDAMILESAVHSKCDFFVSNDGRAFIGKDNKRAIIESNFHIKIFSRSEYLDFIKFLWVKGQKET